MPPAHRSIFTLNRVFGLVLILCAGAWAWTAIRYQRQNADDQAFHAEFVAPLVAESVRQSEAFQMAIEALNEGRQMTMPVIPRPDPAPAVEWVRRMETLAAYRTARTRAQWVYIGVTIAWVAAIVIQRLRRRPEA